jgi:outer membrane lipoprotein carrier protein
MLRSLRRPRLLAAALLLFAGGLAAPSAASSAAGSPEPDPDPDAPGLSLGERFDRLLERVQIEQKQLETLEADFVQEKSSEFLAAPETSRGSFAFASPDRVRWEYAAPKPVSLVIHDDVMLTWYRDLGRAERVKVGRLSSQVLRYLNANSSLQSLLQHFTATATFPADGGPYRLELEPRFARVAKRLDSMILWVDRELFLPVRIRYVEPNGDVTEYRLENLRVNAPVAAERFRLDLPAGVEVREIDLDRGRRQAVEPVPGR